MTTNIRQHVVLAIVTLVLAAIILVLLFLPHQPSIQQFQGPPPSSKRVSPSSSVASLHNSFVIPSFSLQAS